ncbi:MAG: HAD family hydrolase [Candidatus Nanohaloarchaea archaeon]
MTRTPVFDIGDTLLPSERMIRETVEEALRDEGYDEIPDFDIHDYNIYRPEEVRKWLEEHGFDSSAREITREYLDRKQDFLVENGVIEVLKRCGEEFGPIGFISDNAVEAKEFYTDLLDRQGVDYRGFVVSAEVGAKKPDERIFRAFLDERDAAGEEFVYFGNHPERDAACQEVGMEFVWVTRYETFTGSYDGPRTENLEYSTVERFVSEK